MTNVRTSSLARVALVDEFYGITHYDTINGLMLIASATGLSDRS